MNNVMVWLDDARKPPSSQWKWAKTVDEAIAHLAYDNVIEISLDHDLGDWQPTGRVVAEYIANMKMRPTVYIHSMNPVGAKAMRDILEVRVHG